MFTRLKQRKKLNHSKAMKEASFVDYNKEGRAKIEVGLKNSDDFFSPFAYRTYELLNKDVIDYINMCESNIPVTDDIALDIYTEEDTTNFEKERIKKAVKRHHAEEAVAIQRKKKRKIARGIAWLLGGLIILFVEIFALKLSSTHNPIGTLLDVVGWVFAWDGLEILTAERGQLNRKLKKCYRLINAKVHVRKYSKKIQREYGIGEFEEDE